MKTIYNYEEICNLVIKQLNNYWKDTDEEIIKESIPEAFKAVSNGFEKLPN